MSQSLMTGVSGLRAHQNQLDVVANNLANLNTTAFKAQSATFADLMYQTIQAGSGAKDDTFGGTNPQQIGTGVEIAQISRRFEQGTLQATGELLDFAIQGDGFFTLNGQLGERVYSRAGSFGLDERGNLVDPSTGYLVQRTGDVGEATADNFGFQVPGDMRVHIPIGSPVPGKETTTIDVFGNLPSYSTPPLAEILTSFAPFTANDVPATEATLLNDLDINVDDYQAGDMIEIKGSNPDGSTFEFDLPADTATLGDIITAINNNLVGATAELKPSGLLEIEADETGDAFTSLAIEDATGNIGSSKFAKNAMVVTTDGTNGAIFNTTMQVYDRRGNQHSLRLDFQKKGDNVWDLTASLTDEAGELLDNMVTELIFDEDGTFNRGGGDGDGDTNIEFSFASLEEPQIVEIDFVNLNHMSTDFSLSQDQNGAPPGTLVSISVNTTGELRGLATNGENFALAQLALASFRNYGALEAQGGAYFLETINSGEAAIGTGLSGGRGQVIGNQLESSNVDIAREFTQLIVAQRGFSANARTITVADEVLEELTNIIR